MFSASSQDGEAGRGLPWVSPDCRQWSLGVYELFGLDAGSTAPSLPLFMSLVHPQDRGIREQIDRVGTDGFDGGLRFRIVCRDGTVRLVSLIGVESGGEADRRLCIVDHSAAIEAAGGPGPSPDSLPHSDRDGSGLWALHDPGREFTLSPGARAVLGLGPDDRLTLAGFLRQVHPDDRADASDLLTGERPRTRPTRVRFARPDGTAERLIEFAGAAAAEPERARLGALGTVADVTDRIGRAMEAESVERLLETSFENSGDGMLVLDPSGRVRRLNPAARAIFGDIRQGAALWDSFPDLAGDPLRQAVRDVAERGDDVEEERFVPALQMWLAYTLLPLGPDMLLICRSRDEIYRLRSLFNELSTRCDAAFSKGRVTLWELDIARGRVWFARSAKSLLGRSTLTMSEFRSRIVPDDLARVDEARERATATRTGLEVDFRIVTGEGQIKRVRCRGGFADGLMDRATRLSGILVELDGGESRTAIVAPVAAPADAGSAVLTGAQVRAARGALRWSVRELAEHSEVSVATINRFEADSRSVTTRDRSVAALQRVLMEHGISFFTTPDGRPAIAMSPDRPNRMVLSGTPQGELASPAAGN